MNYKEDVKHEKMLREISHRAGNKQCMTCVGHGGRAPQYVCVAFGTFVCTACAGVHRDFQFRVKSISSSKFSKEEVQLTNEVGNDAARALFLAGWYGENERSCPMVENTKTAALKNFIRQVFVERRFEGQRAAPAEQAPAAQLPQPSVVQQPSFKNFGLMPPGQQFQQIQQPQPPPAEATLAHAAADPFGLSGFNNQTTSDVQSQLAPPFAASPAAAAPPPSAQTNGNIGGLTDGNGWNAFSNTPPTAMRPPETQQPLPPAITALPRAPAAQDTFGSTSITPPGHAAVNSTPQTAAAPNMFDSMFGAASAPLAAQAREPMPQVPMPVPQAPSQAAAPDMFGAMFAAPKAVPPAAPTAPAAQTAPPDIYGSMTIAPPPAVAPEPAQPQMHAQDAPGDVFSSMNVAVAAPPVPAAPTAASAAAPAVASAAPSPAPPALTAAPAPSLAAPAPTLAGRQMLSEDLFGGGGMAQPGSVGNMGFGGGAPQLLGGYGGAPQTAAAPPSQLGHFGTGGGMTGSISGPDDAMGGMGTGGMGIVGKLLAEEPSMSSPDPFGDLGASIGVSAPKQKPKPKEPEAPAASAGTGMMGGVSSVLGATGGMQGTMGGMQGMMPGAQMQIPGAQMLQMGGLVQQPGMIDLQQQQLQHQQRMMMMRHQQMMAQQQGLMQGGGATAQMQQGAVMGGQMPQMQPQGFGMGGQQMMPGRGAPLQHNQPPDGGGRCAPSNPVANM